MKLIIAILFFLGFIFLFPEVSSAHPGRTASDGCHYCRTRCDYWGVPWYQRHCHGGWGPWTPTPVFTPTPTPQILLIKATMANDYNSKTQEFSIKFDWDDVPYSMGYSVSISRYPGEDPGPLVDTYKSVWRFNHVQTGRWYLNLKSKDILSWSQIAYWTIDLPNNETRNVK